MRGGLCSAACSALTHPVPAINRLTQTQTPKPDEMTWHDTHSVMHCAGYTHREQGCNCNTVYKPIRNQKTEGPLKKVGCCKLYTWVLGVVHIKSKRITSWCICDNDENMSDNVTASLFQLTSWAWAWFHVPVAFIFFFFLGSHAWTITFAQAQPWSSIQECQSRGAGERHGYRDGADYSRLFWTPFVPLELSLWSCEGASQLGSSFHYRTPCKLQAGSARFASSFTWDMRPASYLTHG